MPKVKKSRIKHVINAAEENTRLKGTSLLSSLYDEETARCSSLDDDRLRSESGSFNSTPLLISFSNMLRTPSPNVQLTDVDNKKDCSLLVTPVTKRNISGRFSSRSRNAFRSRISPMYFSNDRVKECKNDNDAVIEKNENSDKNENLCETPKIRHDTFNVTRRDANLEIVQIKDFLEKKSSEKVCFNRTKSQNEIMHLQGHININPYLDYQPAQIKSNKENVNELSFFTPDLLERKPASTPIHAVNEMGQKPLNEIGYGSSMTSKSRTRRDSVHRQSAFTPVIAEEDLPNLVIVEEPKKMQMKVTEFLSKSAPSGELGCSHNDLKLSKESNKLDHEPGSHKESANNSKDNTAGAMKKVFKQAHKYGAVTAKWTMSLFSVCMKLGFSVKPKITATPSTRSENLESVIACRCNTHQQEINTLNGKIKELRLSIENLQKQVLENIQSNKKVDALHATLDELSKDIESLKILKEEMDNLKNRFNTMSFSIIPQTTMSARTAPPPPPPPPPPPLLPQINQSNILKMTKTSSKSKQETPRPVISLDDILKVKLKKTSERTITTRRSTGSQPEVTEEMLKQVKLRKPLRRSTPSSVPTFSPESMTSPHSSLKKLLKDEGSFKIKRLRRVDGYSFNENKKNKFSRERQ